MMIRTIIVIFTFHAGIANLVASGKLQLRNIAYSEGLRNLNVSSITQDQIGYIWVATRGGVSRFNGYEFKHFYFDPDNSSSLSSNHVTAIYCASDGLIYMGTAGGVNCYNTQTGEMIKLFPGLKSQALKIKEYKGFIYLGTAAGLYRFSIDTWKLEELGNSFEREFTIYDLFFDSGDNIYCALEKNMGLAVYENLSKDFSIIKKTGQDHGSHCNSLRTFFQIAEDTLLIGTKGGISCFKISTKEYISYSKYSNLERALEGVDINFIMTREPSVIWIGTLESGLFIYNKDHGTITRHYQEDGLSEMHSNNYMTCFTDKDDNTWLGTFDAGLDVYFKQTMNFNFDLKLNNLTREKFITTIATDRQNKLIIGTRENGFLIYEPGSRAHSWISTENSRLKNNNLRTILVDPENNYWLGMHYYGLQIYNPSNKSFTTISVPEPNNGITSFFQYENSIFASTDGQGLLVFDLKGNLLQQFTENGTNIPAIIRLNDKELLVASYGFGLFALDFSSYKFRKIELADVNKFPGFLFAISAFKDNDGVVWIGTHNYGLLSIDLKNSTVKNITIKEGLPGTDAVSFEEDDSSNLWIGTSYEMARLNKKDFNIRTYSYPEGINNYQFHERSVLKDYNGVIYFGGNAGLTFFKPEEITKEPSSEPEIILENLYVQNSLVIPSENNRILKQSLPFTGQITLTYRDRSFSVEFVTFDFLSPGKIQYFYTLEGFDKTWYNAGVQRRASYSNLQRGKYVFKVKSVNHSGIESKNEANLSIRVKPAPWFSYLALTIYLLIIASIIFIFIRLRLKAFFYKKNLEIEYSEHLREREVNQMKQKFFTNISHELRTPLTLIYGLVSHLSVQEKMSPRISEIAQSLDLNVSRLLKLLNQLLAYKKLEGETLSLWLDKGDINEAIHRILELFIVYAKEKEIRIEYKEVNIPNFWFDYDKLEKIFSNLLSNAIKHSPKGKEINILVRQIRKEEAERLYIQEFGLHAKTYIEISLSDDGPGIEEKDCSTIFDRYKQIELNGRERPDYSGSGIGLNFTKKLVELHKGSIRVQSKPGQGSTFSFILPFENTVFEAKDYSTRESTQITDTIEDKMPDPSQDTIEGRKMNPDFGKTILIVEDDPQLNMYLGRVLKKFYKTLHASDGEKGLKLALQKHPDLVITDLIMPKKGGIELTKVIKENEELCHIPVILLTAKTETGSQVEGMKSGADLYVTKPFNIDFLLAAIETQFKNRKRIQDIFMKGQMPILENTDINQLDIQFLSKLNAFLEKELSNPELNIDLLAKNMNMSRSAFYRKFMSLTKLSPVVYIKKFRVNKSVELIKSGKYSFAEISELTGFGTPAYFSTAFRQIIGQNPREYANQLKNKK